MVNILCIWRLGVNGHFAQVLHVPLQLTEESNICHLRRGTLGEDYKLSVRNSGVTYPNKSFLAISFLFRLFSEDVASSMRSVDVVPFLSSQLNNVESSCLSTLLIMVGNINF
jgi:hypothetical protein